MLRDLIDKIEEEIKPEIWSFVEDVKTPLQKRIKDTVNLLLDLLEELEDETSDN